MAIQRVITVGDPLLKQKSQSVPTNEIKSDAIQKLIDSMIETMRHYHGVGIAAPQIGVLKSLFIMEVKDNKRYPNNPDFPLEVVINPRIEIIGDENILSIEGCLSIPEIRDEVSRSKSILLSFYDRHCNKRTLNLNGFPAIIAQHEYDHLNGILFTQRVTGFDSDSASINKNLS